MADGTTKADFNYDPYADKNWNENRDIDDTYIQELITKDIRNKPDMVELDWKNYSLHGFDVDELVAMAKQGVDPDLVKGFKESFIQYYVDKVEDDLPPVCEPGKQCRVDIRVKARDNIEVVWQTGLTEI